MTQDYETSYISLGASAQLTIQIRPHGSPNVRGQTQDYMNHLSTLHMQSTQGWNDHLHKTDGIYIYIYQFLRKR